MTLVMSTLIEKEVWWHHHQTYDAAILELVAQVMWKQPD